MNGGIAWDRWALGLLALALLNAANGTWMLVDPTRWFHDLPADVPDFGPYNEHFVRDVGAAFVTAGVALAWAALRPVARLPLVGVIAVFYALHAAGHVYDTARGAVAAHHWWLDLPSIYLPAVLLVVLTAVLARRGGAASKPEGS